MKAPCAPNCFSSATPNSGLCFSRRRMRSRIPVGRGATPQEYSGETKPSQVVFYGHVTDVTGGSDPPISTQRPITQAHCFSHQALLRSPALEQPQARAGVPVNLAAAPGTPPPPAHHPVGVWERTGRAGVWARAGDTVNRVAARWGQIQAGAPSLAQAVRFPLMILLQVHLQQPCYDFCFL